MICVSGSCAALCGRGQTLCGCGQCCASGESCIGTTCVPLPP
jgi:hypothetical protein